MKKKYTKVISFRTTEEEKNSFIKACDRFAYIPSKFSAGNVLRRFIISYPKNPRYFENIFNKFISINANTIYLFKSRKKMH